MLVLYKAMRRLAKYERGDRGVGLSWRTAPGAAGEFRVHTEPIVPLGSGGESEFELSRRGPNADLPGTPKRRKGCSGDVSIRADDDDSFC